eukprot:749490-Hanusia_phi.AAC.6
MLFNGIAIPAMCASAVLENSDDKIVRTKRQEIMEKAAARNVAQDRVSATLKHCLRNLHLTLDWTEKRHLAPSLLGSCCVHSGADQRRVHRRSNHAHVCRVHLCSPRGLWSGSQRPARIDDPHHPLQAAKAKQLKGPRSPDVLGLHPARPSLRQVDSPARAGAAFSADVISSSPALVMLTMCMGSGAAKPELQTVSGRVLEGSITEPHRVLLVLCSFGLTGLSLLRPVPLPHRNAGLNFLWLWKIVHGAWKACCSLFGNPHLPCLCLLALPLFVSYISNLRNPIGDHERKRVEQQEQVSALTDVTSRAADVEVCREDGGAQKDTGLKPQAA